MSGSKRSERGAILRFLNKRRLFIAFSVLLIAFLALLGGIAFYLRSAAFQERVRQYVVDQIVRQTGATANLGGIHWNLLHEAVVLDDLTIRGLEAADEAPLAHIRQIEVHVHFST